MPRPKAKTKKPAKLGRIRWEILDRPGEEYPGIEVMVQVFDKDDAYVDADVFDAMEEIDAIDMPVILALLAKYRQRWTTEKI